MKDKDKVIPFLLQEEMDKIESQIVNNQVNTAFIDDRDDIIGVDDDEITQLFTESEKIAGKICKNIIDAHSIMVNNKNINIMEKAKFTAAELSVITNRYNEIHSSANELQSLKENLVAYIICLQTHLSQKKMQQRL